MSTAKFLVRTSKSFKIQNVSTAHAFSKLPLAIFSSQFLSDIRALTQSEFVWLCEWRQTAQLWHCQLLTLQPQLRHSVTGC
jgi:hypothetical protein